MPIVFVDIETSSPCSTDRETIVCVGAWRPSDESDLRVEGAGLGGSAGERLRDFVEAADFVVGHNIERHDWPALVEQAPALEVFEKRLIDTLVLNPLAFPRNPYHRLVKDYKLSRHALNDPVADCQVCGRLYGDQIRAFLDEPEAAALYAELLGEPYRDWFHQFVEPTTDEPRLLLADRADGQACSVAIADLLGPRFSRVDEDVRRCWAYVSAWLAVAGGSSVLPGWVRRQHPLVGRLVERLRGSPCESENCEFCRQSHDPEAGLRRFFGFDGFRDYGDTDGEPLQRRIVRQLSAGRSTVAVLPTGGGKSLCYQLPAMTFGSTRGALTIVLSPLQSLMQDQVDALERRGYSHAASLTGRLTLPERRKTLDGIALGDVHLLFVAPEQLRNRSFVHAIGQREIAQWVIDEAHCLSKWGHDFRPDYLYIGRFIARHTPDVPVHGFTATARPEVLGEISEHLTRHLELEPDVIVAGHARSNLTYRVERCGRSARMARITELLESHAEELRRGGAIVFCARRRTTELVAEFLQNNGWSADYFHAGRRPNDKRLVQDAFIAGELDVIAATCAFGMGVDKPDVRLVVHANMPDSLENYLQEAGRAGRDGRPAECVLLYDEEDADDQFERSRRQQITLRDFRSIYRSVRERLGARRRARSVGDSELVASAGELLRTARMDDDVENRVGFDLDDPQFDTKVRTALAWMEECEPPLLRRRENRVGVVQGGLRIKHLEEIDRHLRELKIPPSKRKIWLKLAEELMAHPGESSISADELADRTGLEGREVYRHLQGMRDASILDHDLTLHAWVTKGGPGDSRRRLKHLHAVENDFMRLVEERGDFDGSFHLETPYAAALLSEMAGREVSSEMVNSVLRLWSQVDRTIAARRVGYEEHRVRFREDWNEFHQRSAERRDVCSVELNHLLDQIPEGVRGGEVAVSFKLGAVLDALRTDQSTRLIVAGEETRGVKAAEDGLVALQRSTVVDLEHGGAVFYPGMTLEVIRGRGAPGHAEFRPLAEHYAGQIRQVHIIREWAVTMADGDDEAGSRLLDDYFALPAHEFDERWFDGRTDDLYLPATEARQDEIVDGLSDVQCHIVAETEGNLLILAGPGSGKTMTLVHRIAWLVGVERVAPWSILALSYNRSTGVELRHRLRELIGKRANRVAIFTFHALAMRIAGEPPPDEADADELSDWADRVLARATTLLNDPDAQTRDRLVAGLEHVVVDEYQDITEARYEFLSALVGRTLRDPERKLQLMAVGDDDQNVYEWQGASNEYIRRFREDYSADAAYLVDNWRSGRRIVEVANRLIAPHPGRLKASHPIVAARNVAGSVRRLGGSLDSLTSFVATECRDRFEDRATVAILVRTRHEMREWARALRSMDLPVVTVPQTGRISWRGLRPVDDVLAVLREELDREDAPGAVSPKTLQTAMRERAPHTRDVDTTRGLWEAVADMRDSYPDVRFPAQTWWSLVCEIEAEQHTALHAGIEVRTMHAAKGQQYDVVFVVGGGAPRPADESAERRLHYVAVTRARDELILLEPDDSHPWFDGLGVDGEACSAPPLPRDRDIVSLGAEDVDLGFLGRCEADRRESVAALEPGDVVDVRQHGNRFLVFDGDGVVIGRLSAAASERLIARLDGGGWQIGDARIRTFQRRYVTQADPEFTDTYCRERWEAVIPEVELVRE